MFGFNLGIGSSLLAPAAAAFASGPAGRRLPGRPSLSLALSGALHGALLALFLVVWGSGAPEPPGVEIRVWTTPTIDFPTAIPPPAERQGRAAPDDRGRITPREGPDIEVTPEVAPEAGPILDGRGATPTAERGAPGTGEPGPAPPARAEDPDLPSLYEEPPVAVHAPDPEYPWIAREAGIEGRFLVEALVGRDGRVRDTRIGEANPILAEAARNAILRWRFKPAQWNGKPVAAWVSIPVVFRLQ